MNMCQRNAMDPGDNPFKDWLAAQQVACMAVARAHFATDVVSGFVCGRGIWMRVRSVCPMDLWIASMTLLPCGLCEVVGFDMILA